MQDNNILGFLVQGKKTKVKEVKTEIIDGQEVKVKVYPSNKRNKTWEFGKIRGKQIHDARLTEHLSEEEMEALEKKRVKKKGLLASLFD